MAVSSFSPERGTTTTTTRGPSTDHNPHQPLKNKMTGIIDKVRDAISPHRGMTRDASRERDPNAPDEERRGRSPATNHHGHGHGTHHSPSSENFIATGRGGAGNMVRSKSPPSSKERSKHSGGTLSVEEERAQSRQRARSKDAPQAMGRGGAGNIRSPSRDPTARAQEEAAVKKLDAEEHAVEAKYEKELKEHATPVATGRGGAGNIV